jgi:pimeloyl-[acyl-carrier protein] synthase
MLTQPTDEAPLPIWNPYTKGYRENPHEHLNQLREQNPVHRAINGRWMLLRHADVKAAFGNPVFRTLKFHEILAQKQAVMPEGSNMHDVSASTRNWLLYLDPPDHTRPRNLMMRVWNQHKVRAIIEDVITETLTDLRTQQRADLVTDVAGLVPTKIIFRVLGFPDADFHRLRGWTMQLVQAVEPFKSVYDLQVLNDSVRDFQAYLEALAESKRTQPDDTFLSKYLLANDQADDPLTVPELLAAFVNLFFAGTETSVYLFGQSLLALIQHPAQTQQLRQNPALIQAAAEELFRYVSTVNYTLRVPAEDVTIRGVPIRAGEIVSLSVIAANYDPAVFDDPDQLRFDRPTNPHIAFGHGSHHCMGSRLAREMLQVLVLAFVEQFPTVRLDPERPPVWASTITNRGLSSLPVCLTP